MGARRVTSRQPSRSLRSSEARISAPTGALPLALTAGAPADGDPGCAPRPRRRERCPPPSRHLLPRAIFGHRGAPVALSPDGPAGPSLGGGDGDGDGGGGGEATPSPLVRSASRPLNPKPAQGPAAAQPQSGAHAQQRGDRRRPLDKPVGQFLQ